jgi:hypothetical protein
LVITAPTAEENAIIKELPKLNYINKQILRKNAALGGTDDPDANVSDLIKEQLEMAKVAKENRQKTLKKRLKIIPEDVEDPHVTSLSDLRS